MCHLREYLLRFRAYFMLLPTIQSYMVLYMYVGCVCMRFLEIIACFIYSIMN